MPDAGAIPAHRTEPTFDGTIDHPLNLAPGIAFVPAGADVAVAVRAIEDPIAFNASEFAGMRRRNACLTRWGRLFPTSVVGAGTCPRCALDSPSYPPALPSPPGRVIDHGLRYASMSSRVIALPALSGVPTTVS